MTSKRHYSIQLVDALTGAPIVTSGGVVYVAKNGASGKETLYSDAIGTSASNPKALTRGHLDFWVTPTTNEMVDLYIQCPGGQFAVVRNVIASGPNDIPVDLGQTDQMMVIPFNQADFSATVETDTGFDEPAANTAVFLADAASAAIRLVTADATETLDVGTISTDSGDADGFISAVSLTTTGIVQDNGALLGTLVGHISGGKSITITTSSGADTGVGFIYLAYRLMQ